MRAAGHTRGAVAPAVLPPVPCEQTSDRLAGGSAWVCDMEVGTRRLALYQGTGFSRATTHR
jgi:hypothetical protein